MNNINKIVAVLLLIALLPLPYFYYQLLRIIVSFAAILNAFKFYSDYPSQSTNMFLLPFKLSDRKYNILTFVVILTIWNPIFPIYMDKSVWMISDIIGAGVFFFCGSDD